MSMISQGSERMRLMWMCLQTAILLSPVLAVSSPGDFTSFHLANYLNRSVSPCSDFHRHVCSIEMKPEDTAVYKSMQFYENLAEELHIMTRHNPILNDIVSVREAKMCFLDSESYKSNLQERCGSSFKCYVDEFYYFFHLYEMIFVKEESLKFFEAHVNTTEQNIPRILSVTSRMIRSLMLNMDKYYDDFVEPYVNLHDRLSIMSALESHPNIMDSFGVDRLQSTLAFLKKTISSRFMETSWLNETDKFELDKLFQYLTTLEEIRIVADFDEFDLNVTTWKQIDRFITAKYFEYSKRSTGCARFDVFHPFLTLKKVLDSNNDSGLSRYNFVRMQGSMRLHNAFNQVQHNHIAIFAPTFYPFMWENSSDVTQIGFAGCLLGHEIFHSFIDLSNSNYVFQHEAECIIDHFSSSCGRWGKDGCSSGRQTFEEDGPDVESMRVAYEILKNTYSEDELQEIEFEDLGITRKQSFFYSFALRHCRGHSDHDHTDVHSDSRIRVNAVVGMMPEFTAAFECKKGDEEYSEEATSCYLFGPLAGAERYVEPSEETETENGDQGVGQEKDGSGKKEENDRVEEGSGEVVVDTNLTEEEDTTHAPSGSRF